MGTAQVQGKALAEILRILERNPALWESFPEEQRTKYRIVAERLSENPTVRPFRVVFCGVFSSGKTSLINSLLASTFTLPQGVNPVTKLVTRIRGGETVACAYRLNGRETAVSTDYLDALIRGRKELIFGSKELIVTLPSTLLRDRTELLDTPGFNDEVGGALEQLSREAFYEADMAVMCCNALQLGKLTERSLLSELDGLMGHYSLAVTRMDNLNTTEDCEAVTAQAHRLMKGKGNDARIFGGANGFVFPMVTAGAFCDTSQFANYLRAIVNDEATRRDIRAVSDAKCLRQCLDEIRPALQVETDRLRREVDSLEVRNREAIRRQELDARMAETRLSGLGQTARHFASQTAQQRLSTYAADIRTIPNPNAFQPEAERLANRLADTLVHDLASYAEREKLADYGSVRAVLSRAWQGRGFVVPPPVPARIPKRGLIGRVVRTVRNFLTFRFRIDDGCEDGFADYFTPAAEAVRVGLVEPILREWDSYLSHLHRNLQMTGFSGGCEQTIADQRGLLRECENALRLTDG